MGWLKTSSQPKSQPAKTESPVFNLSNPYHFAFMKAGNSFVGSDRPIFQKQLSAEKIRQPILHLNEGPGIKFISFDFDSKAPAVHAAVWASFSGWAIVSKSPSGNIKALVPLTGYATKELSLEERRAYITATLERLKIAHICIPDLSAGALNLCFISEGIYRAMQDYWRDGMPVLTRQQFQDSLPKVSISGGNLAGITEPIVQQQQNKPKFQYFQATKDSFNPTIMRYIKRTTRGSGLRLKLVQILVACYGLYDATDGFGLSSKVIAAQLDCSHTFVLNELQELQDRRLLECSDETHCYVGRKAKAKSYLACGALLQELKKFKEEGGTRVGRLPTHIEDGKWNDAMLKYVGKFKSGAEFCDWISTIPGYYQKTRQKEAEYIGRWHFRKQALKGLGNYDE